MDAKIQKHRHNPKEITSYILLSGSEFLYLRAYVVYVFGPTAGALDIFELRFAGKHADVVKVPDQITKSQCH